MTYNSSHVTKGVRTVGQRGRKYLFIPAIICQVYQQVKCSFVYQDCRKANTKNPTCTNSWWPGGTQWGSLQHSPDS